MLAGSIKKSLVKLSFTCTPKAVYKVYNLAAYIIYRY